MASLPSLLVVDGANVVGATPDGWWKDRAGAARRLHERLLVADTAYDEIVLVLARMMAKDPIRRYQTPAELIAHLKGLAERMKLSTDSVEHDSVVRAVAAERGATAVMPQGSPETAAAFSV